MLLRFLLCFIFLASSAQAATYYFADTGSDGAACSIGAPCKTVSKANSVHSGSDVLLFECGNYGLTQNANARLLPKSGTAVARTYIGPYGTCTASNLPIFDGTGLSYTSGHGLIHIDTNSYITIQGVVVQDFARHGIRSFVGASNITVDSVIIRFGTSERSIVLNGTNNITHNVYSHDNAKQNHPASAGVNHTITNNTFEDTASDPTLGVSCTDNAGGVHTVRENIIRDNNSASQTRTLVNLQVDVTGGGCNPPSVKHVLFTNNFIHDSVGEGLTMRMHAQALSDARIDDILLQYNTILNTVQQGSLFVDDRTSPNPAHWTNIRAQDNVFWAITDNRIFDVNDGITLTTLTNNASLSTATERGNSPVTISSGTHGFVNISGSTRNINLTASSALYRTALDTTKSLGAMQPPYLPSDPTSIRITAAAPNTVVLSLNSVFPLVDITTIASLVPGGSAITPLSTSTSCGYTVGSGQWFTINGTLRTNTGCTINGTEVSVTFDGAATQSGHSATYNIPRGVFRAGQLGSSLGPGYLRHESVSMSGTIDNQVGGAPSVGTLDQTHYRFRRIGVAGEAFGQMATVRNGAQNSAITVPAGSIHQVRLKVGCNGGIDCATTSFAPYACDGTCGTPSNWYLLTDTFGGNLVRLSRDPAAMGGGNTTEQLNACGTFVTGRYLDADSSSFPQFSLTSGQCTEFVVIFEVATTASNGQVILLGMQRSDGTDLDSTVNPQLTVGVAQAQR